MAKSDWVTLQLPDIEISVFRGQKDIDRMLEMLQKVPCLTDLDFTKHSVTITLEVTDGKEG